MAGLKGGVAPPAAQVEISPQEILELLETVRIGTILKVFVSDNWSRKNLGSFIAKVRSIALDTADQPMFIDFEGSHQVFSRETETCHGDERVRGFKWSYQGQFWSNVQFKDVWRVEKLEPKRVVFGNAG